MSRLRRCGLHFDFFRNKTETINDGSRRKTLQMLRISRNVTYLNLSMVFTCSQNGCSLVVSPTTTNVYIRRYIIVIARRKLWTFNYPPRYINCKTLPCFSCNSATVSVRWPTRWHRGRRWPANEMRHSGEVLLQSFTEDARLTNLRFSVQRLSGE